MRCQIFELAVVDLARGGAVLDDRGEALAHALACERCRARLEAERALSADLAAVAAADRTVEAPARVEADLRAAFRAVSAPPAVASPRRRVASLAAAAAVAALAGGALAYRAAVAPKSIPLPAEPPVAKVLAPEAKTPLSAGRAPVVERQTLAAPTGERGARRPVRTAETPRPVRDRGDAGPHELATAYYSLTGGGEVVPRDGWQIVRVEVPRASLGALGFAVNPALADEPITADVMLGHDGVARAIRFVQTTESGERRNR